MSTKKVTGSDLLSFAQNVKTTTATAIGVETTNRKNYAIHSASYDNLTKRINFYNDATTPAVLAYIDATAFVKDGMLSNVAISNGNLVFTFNTDSGKQDISIALTDIFNPNNYYTKTEVDSMVEAIDATELAAIIAALS